MVEATPAAPYGSFTSDLCKVEPNMRLRRYLIDAKLRDGEKVVTMSNFPLLGVTTENYSFSTPAYPIGGEVCKSNYIHDKVMSPHPRFATLSGNIRRRRGKRVNIKHPLYIDKYTNTEPGPNGSAGNGLCLDERESLRPRGDEIHMDAMVFGMGCCCLQVTFQTRSVHEARNLYDQLGAVSPIFLALTANTPFHRGRIADTDVRWDTISYAVDDRTDEEFGLEPLTKQQCKAEGITSAPPPSPTLSPDSYHEEEEFLLDNNPISPNLMQTATVRDISCKSGLHGTVGIPSVPPHSNLRKSRYSSIDCYIGQDKHYNDAYNDVKFKYDQSVYFQLRTEGIDCLLSKHIASLFVRDPLVIFEGKINVDDSMTTEHFESIQSTNWRSVRFKPPPMDTKKSIGWRVEFRTMEVQMTDFENAAFTVFIALLTRAITFFNLNFYIPLSQVDANFTTAHKNDAVRKEKFYMRKNVRSCYKPSQPLVTTDMLLGKVDATLLKSIAESADTPSSTNIGSPSYTGNETTMMKLSPSTASHPRSTHTDSYSDDLLTSLKDISNVSNDILDLCRNNSSPFQWEDKSKREDDNNSLCIDCQHITAQPVDSNTCPVNDCSELMTMTEIFCGKAPSYPGLIPIVKRYLDSIKCDIITRKVIDKYLTLIEMRAKGELLTGAQFLRQFVYSHPSYASDSVLTPDIVYEIALLSDLTAQDKVSLPELIGTLNLDTKDIFIAISQFDEEFLSSISFDDPNNQYLSPSYNSQSNVPHVYSRQHENLTKILDAYDMEIPETITEKNEKVIVMSRSTSQNNLQSTQIRLRGASFSDVSSIPCESGLQEAEIYSDCLSRSTYDSNTTY